MAKVSLNALSKSYGEKGASKVEAVKDLDMEIDDGSLACLLGPSGCGKTTVMRLISGLISPTTGKIYFDGRDITDVPAEDRNVAMTFQFPVIYPTMTVYDNIRFPLQARRLPEEEIKTRSMEAVDFLDLRDQLNRRAKGLDATLKQKVALARALVREPNILLLDEPLSNIDPKARVELRTKIKSMHRKLKVTCLYVTHDQAEALTLADSIGVMNLGKLVQYDTPENLYNSPINTFVGWFIGNPGMNLLDASCKEVGPRTVIDFGDFQVDVDKSVADTIKEKLPSGELTFGIRPEHVRAEKSQIEGGVKAKCAVVEDLGTLRIALLRIGKTELRAKTEAYLNEGEEVWVGFPRAKVRIFDKTGNVVV